MVEIYKDKWNDPLTKPTTLYIIINQHGVWAYNVSDNAFARILNQDKLGFDKFERASWLELLVVTGISRTQAEQVKIQSQKLEWFTREEALSGLV